MNFLCVYCSKSHPSCNMVDCLQLVAHSQSSTAPVTRRALLLPFEHFSSWNNNGGGLKAGSLKAIIWCDVLSSGIRVGLHQKMKHGGEVTRIVDKKLVFHIFEKQKIRMVRSTLL